MVDIRTLPPIDSGLLATAKAVVHVPANGGDPDTLYLADVSDFIDPLAMPTIKTVAGAAYELVLEDTNIVLELDHPTSIVCTIPANADVAFPIGTLIEVHQVGAGEITFQCPTDTLQLRGSNFYTAGQYAIVGLRKVAATVWRLTGDLAA